MKCFAALKVEKKAGEEINYTKLKVKELKTILGIVFSSFSLLCSDVMDVVFRSKRGKVRRLLREGRFCEKMSRD